MKINILETGPDYVERIESLDAELTGGFSDWVAQAAELVSNRGYRVMPTDEGGNCEVTAYDDHEEVGITVYPKMKSEARNAAEANNFSAARIIDALAYRTGVETDLDRAADQTLYTFLDDGSQLVISGSDVRVIDVQSASE